MTSEPSPAQAVPAATFEAFYARTARAAYGLALRIAGDGRAATEACEAAYAEAWPQLPALGEGAALEAHLLERVRLAALTRRSEPGSTEPAAATYTTAGMVRDALEGLDPVTRRAIDLCYFGGLSVNDIAGIVNRPAPELRAALRKALLDVGARLPAATEARR